MELAPRPDRARRLTRPARLAALILSSAGKNQPLRPRRSSLPAVRRDDSCPERNRDSLRPTSDAYQQIEARRKVFIRKWRVKHRAVADSLEEAGARLFSFTRLPPEQWKSARTTNAIERLHEEFKRRIKTQTVLPSAETAAMLFWALLASGQINMRRVDGWKTLAAKPIAQPIDLAA